MYERYADTNNPRLSVISKNTRKPKVVFLLGAGSSIPAGIPSIDGLTKQFIGGMYGIDKKEKINLKKKRAPSKFFDLAEICRSEIGKPDLESIMSLLVKLENKKFKETLTYRYPPLANMGNETLSELKQKIQEHIRRKCEIIKNTDYLWGLEGFLSKNPLKIFTLNYDGVIEVFCQKNNITYTDGFNPFWDPDLFKQKFQVHLHKLHGSLYWFRAGEGNFIKVPIKGLQIHNLKYLTNDKVSEMLIYPELEKNKQQIVYSSLFQTFREQLNEADLCIVIGYSFRDKEIRDSIKEALSSNSNLWLIFVNPSASSIKNNHFPKNPETSSRIVVMNSGIEAALGERKLFGFIKDLAEARESEISARQQQSTEEDRLDWNWKKTLGIYLKLDHHDRVKHIIEMLSKFNFKEIRGDFNDSLEALLCPYSLRYMMNYNKTKKRSQKNIWKKIFLDSCTLLEYTFFNNNKDLQDHNPVRLEDLSRTIQNYSSSGNHIISKLKLETDLLLNTIIDKSIRDSLEKLSQTCGLLTLKKNISPSGNSYNPVTSQEIIDGYKNNNLGIKKWSENLGLNLEKSRIKKEK